MEEFLGVVSAATPEASESGAEILKEGGNAIDAALAVAFVLGVTEPAGSGIGGQSTFIIQEPQHVPFVINGTSFSPAAVPSDMHISELVKHKASTVPSIVKVLDFAWKNYGSGKIPWKRLLEPSIHFAKQGYALGPFRHKALLRHENRIKRNSIAKDLLLNPDGSIPAIGSTILSPILGETLQRLSEEGADDFYSGEIAREIDRDMKDNEGFITLQDLNEIKPPRVLPAVSAKYRSWDVASLPPPASGWAVLMALNILENIPEDIIRTESSKRLFWTVQALKLIHRHRLLSPISDLLNYEDMVYKKISKEKAHRIVHSLLKTGIGETTHFSVVDSIGRAVGVTQSLNSYYGAMVASPKLGFMYNDYMREFVPGSRQNPFALRPSAMPYSSMSASILSKNSIPELVLGSPGNERIISAVVQVISNWVDLGQGIEGAVQASRLHTGGDEEIMIETRPDNVEALLFLEKKGFTLYTPLSSLFSGDLNPYFGGVHAIAKEDGAWIGAADPRRDGKVVYA
jgi:gamma-glutamyltranspeptidase/glutathione hydrolase